MHSLAKHWVECVRNEVVLVIDLLLSYFQLEVWIRLHTAMH